jgi:hypothetical protein
VVLMQMVLQHSLLSKQDSSLPRQSVQVLLGQTRVPQHSEPSLQKLPFDRQTLHWPLSQRRVPQQSLSVLQAPLFWLQHIPFSHKPEQHSPRSVQEPPTTRQARHTPVVPLGLQKSLQH